MNETMTPADISAIMGNSDGFGGGSAWWIIILFLFAFMGGGFGGFGNAGGLTQQDALINQNFDNLARNVQSISDRQYEQANNLTKGICELGYTTAQNTNNVQTVLGNAITTEGRAIQSQICALNSNIDNKFAEMEKSRLEQKIADQAQQISALQLSTSQCAQNQYLINSLRPAPVPSFPASNLYGYYGCGCNQ